MSTKPIATLALVLALAIAPPAWAAVRGENVAAPDFAIKTVQGTSLRLADFKGKVLVLNFWATWCGPCREEIPGFVEAYKENQARGLEILGLSVDRMTPEKLLAFMQKAGINYPVALADESIIGAYGPGEYIPSTIVVDKKGVIRFRRVGQIEKAELVKLFNELAAEK